MEHKRIERPITPRLKHFSPGSLVTLKIDKKQYTVGQRKDDRYVWLSEAVFAGLDCVVSVEDHEYPDFWKMYRKSFKKSVEIVEI